eukprot:SAG25_NODE_6725_length_535_cov_0.580275_1_plen_87_part_10
MDTPADAPADDPGTAPADDPASKVSHVRRSIPPSIVTFFYAPLIVMSPQSTAARKIQAIHRGPGYCCCGPSVPSTHSDRSSVAQPPP